MTCNWSPSHGALPPLTIRIGEGISSYLKRVFGYGQTKRRLDTTARANWDPSWCQLMSLCHPGNRTVRCMLILIISCRLKDSHDPSAAFPFPYLLKWRGSPVKNMGQLDLGSLFSMGPKAAASMASMPLSLVSTTKIALFTYKLSTDKMFMFTIHRGRNEPYV